VIWSDNSGAEATTRKATAKAFDHLCLVHGIWLRAAELRTEIFVKRVPTKVNVADDPSRERCSHSRVHACIYVLVCAFVRYSLINQIAGKIASEKTVPRLDDVFLQAQTWEALSILGVFH